MTKKMILILIPLTLALGILASGPNSSAHAPMIPTKVEAPASDPVPITPGYTYRGEVKEDGYIEVIATPDPAPCQEDDPCWDCATMGNHICSPTQADLNDEVAATHTSLQGPEDAVRVCLSDGNIMTTGAAEVETNGLQASVMHEGDTCPMTVPASVRICLPGGYVMTTGYAEAVTNDLLGLALEEGEECI